VISFQAEGWADNWYSLYINGKKVGEDSVPITTIRSFNQTTIKFKASYPFTVGVIAKDYVENNSGLEYIGQSNQQIGDGGFILQIRDLSTGKIVASSNKTWKSLVINSAPINPSCEKSPKPLTECQWKTIGVPTSWANPTYKDTNWASASEFTPEEVGVKEGFNDIPWSPTARLIWSKDLRLDNIILFRHTIRIAESNLPSSLSLVISSTSVDSNGMLNKQVTCDGSGLSPSLAWSQGPEGTQSYLLLMDTIPGPPRPGDPVSTDHTYLAVYNIPSNITKISEGVIAVGTLGLNFKSKTSYEPPCSQGPGLKDYTFQVLALSSNLPISQASATQQSLLSASNGLVLASGKLIAHYERN
jgi:phosphatidylethanolamine-binding protein (PEBP) family uncharacterized protein